MAEQTELRDQESEAAERFIRETVGHALTVIRDDGPYRHLRVRASESWAYGYGIVTWPGYLAIYGDCGAFMFSRLDDMFQFFRADNGRINPDYWAQKLVAPVGTDSVRRWSEAAFRRMVAEWRDEHIMHYMEDPADLEREGYPAAEIAEAKAAISRFYRLVQEDILTCEAYSADEARDVIDAWNDEARHDNDRPVIEDFWEWSPREWDWQFLWCCHAIVKAIALYDAVGKRA